MAKKSKEPKRKHINKYEHESRGSKSKEERPQSKHAANETVACEPEVTPKIPPYKESRFKLPLVLFDLKERSRDYTDPHILYAGKVKWVPPTDPKNHYAVGVKNHGCFDGVWYTYAAVRGSSHLRTELQLKLPSGSVRNFRNLKSDYGFSLDDIFDPGTRDRFLEFLTQRPTENKPRKRESKPLQYQDNDCHFNGPALRDDFRGHYFNRI